MILEVDNVELNFRFKSILNGVYLKCETRKITGILGSNGTGKSCLLKIIFGSLKAKYALIRLDNKPVLKPLYKTNLVSYLPQRNFIPNQLKIHEAFGLYKVNWNTFVTVFPLFKKYKIYRINMLSGGERRVVETYLAIKKDCKILLLDEPFSHIAPIYVDVIIELIKQEKAHKTIMLTDHMYRHIINNSDVIYLLKNGSTKLINNLEELEQYRYLSFGAMS